MKRKNLEMCQRAMLAAALVGCANRPADAEEEGATDSGSGSGAETGTDTDTDTDTGTESETGDLPDVPPQCGDGVHVPGERCWDEVVTYPTVGNPGVMGVFDIDGDGYSEVLYGRNDGVNHVIWPSMGQTPVLQAGLDRRIRAVCVDGRSLAAGSLFAVEQTGPNSNEIDLIRLRHDPNQPDQLQVHSRVTLENYSLGCGVGDLDGDGVPEVVIGLFPADRLTVVRVTPDAMTVAQTLPVGRHPRDLQLADLDGDGRDEVVVALDNLFGSFGAPDSYTGPGEVAVLRANPDGELLDPVAYQVVDLTHGVDIGDLDQDGALDIVATGVNSRVESGEVILAQPGEEVVTILWGDGAGGVDERMDLLGGFSARNARIADFDGDGRLDFMTVAGDPALDLEHTNVQLWFGSETPRVFERLDIPLNQGLYFDVGDFSGNGLLEFVAFWVTTPGLDFVLSNP